MSSAEDLDSAEASESVQGTEPFAGKTEQVLDEVQLPSSDSLNSPEKTVISGSDPVGKTPDTTSFLVNSDSPSKSESQNSGSSSGVSGKIESDGSDNSSALPSINLEMNDKGGEWELLNQKLKTLLRNYSLTEATSSLRQPLLVLAALILFFIVLQIYGSILGTVARVPLAPRLFEFVGIIWFTWFSTSRLVRSKDRTQLISDLKERWKNFSSTSSSEG